MMLLLPTMAKYFGPKGRFVLIGVLVLAAALIWARPQRGHVYLRRLPAFAPGNRQVESH